MLEEHNSTEYEICLAHKRCKISRPVLKEVASEYEICLAHKRCKISRPVLKEVASEYEICLAHKRCKISRPVLKEVASEYEICLAHKRCKISRPVLKEMASEAVSYAIHCSKITSLKENKNYINLCLCNYEKPFLQYLSWQIMHSVKIYWAKVLPEQWTLLQIFRKHEIFRKILRMYFEQTIIHLSKSLNFILIKCLQITSFVNLLEVPTQNVLLQK